jgi:DNA invertase Pin-like site-specific DNA recombinase
VSESKVTASHLRRPAVIYVRQSPLAQVGRNTESAMRQYDLVARAQALGWPRSAVTVIDEDLGVSGASAAGRSGFAQLAAQVGLGQVGIVLSLECSRLARNNTDWYRLLGAPRGAVYSGGDGRAPPPGRRSGLVKRAAA